MDSTILPVMGKVHKGIIRGRWDGRSPRLAEMIRDAVWVLKIVPEQGIKADVATVKELVAKDEFIKALYLLEIMPESIESAALKYQCKLEVSEMSAARYFEFIQEDYVSGSGFPNEVGCHNQEWFGCCRCFIKKSKKYGLSGP